MAELLYLPSINPSEQALHHAILYRDSLSTLVPSDPLPDLPDSLRMAFDAGIYKPLEAAQLWDDAAVRAEVAGLTWGSSSNHSHVAHRLYADAVWEQTNELGHKLIPSPPEEGTISVTVEVEVDLNLYGGIVDIDPHRWSNTVRDVFGESLKSMVERNRRERWHKAWSSPYWQLRLLVSTAYSLAGRARSDVDSPIVIPCYPVQMGPLFADCVANTGSSDHLLARVDVGKFLPEAPSGIETARVIAFRERYDDERRQLLEAVEKLVSEAARAHGTGQPLDIERAVRKELKTALADMKKAGKSVLGGWVKRVAWFGVAAGVGSVFGPAGAAIGAAAGSVAANWASNPVPAGRRSGEHADLNYLYRVQNHLDDFTRMSI
jgi:hypothetical protein